MKSNSPEDFNVAPEDFNIVEEETFSGENNIFTGNTLGIDVPLQNDFSIEDSISQKEESFDTLREKHRHEESKKLLDMAAGLLMVALVLLMIIWIIAIWLEPDQREFSLIFIEILKTVTLTTIGFICGNKLDK